MRADLLFRREVLAEIDAKLLEMRILELDLPVAALLAFGLLLVGS